MKVKVVGPYQIVHEEKVYTEGDVIDAHDVDAKAWVVSGLAEEVKASHKAVSPKASGKK